MCFKIHIYSSDFIIVNIKSHNRRKLKKEFVEEFVKTETKEREESLIRERYTKIAYQKATLASKAETAQGIKPVSAEDTVNRRITLPVNVRRKSTYKQTPALPRVAGLQKEPTLDRNLIKSKFHLWRLKNQDTKDSLARDVGEPPFSVNQKSSMMISELFEKNVANEKYSVTELGKDELGGGAKKQTGSEEQGTKKQIGSTLTLKSNEIFGSLAEDALGRAAAAGEKRVVAEKAKPLQAAAAISPARPIRRERGSDAYDKTPRLRYTRKVMIHRSVLCDMDADPEADVIVRLNTALNKYVYVPSVPDLLTASDDVIPSLMQWTNTLEKVLEPSRVPRVCTY